jgi:hypothetical protein
MNKMEQVVVYLSAVNELLGSMLNYELMTLGGEGDRQSVQFKSTTHQQFFYIALVDFLSPTDKHAPVPSVPYLGALRAISDAQCVGYMTKRRTGKYLVYRLAFEGFGKSSSGLGHEHSLWWTLSTLSQCPLSPGQTNLRVPLMINACWV